MLCGCRKIMIEGDKRECATDARECVMWATDEREFFGGSLNMCKLNAADEGDC